jgi:hypothetical protein
MSKPRDNEKYGDEEAQSRFMQSLKAAVNTSPKPRKSMTPKRSKAQQPKRTGK